MEALEEILRLHRGGFKYGIPIFSGDDANGWVNRVDLYFRMNATPETKRLPAVMLALEGRALNWFLWWEGRTENATWSMFRLAVVRRFQPRHPYRELLRLRQTGTVSDYRDEFERIAGPLRTVNEEVLREVWMNGLREVLRAELDIYELDSVDDLMDRAQLLEARNLKLFNGGGEELEKEMTQASAKTDVEDLRARLDQEMAARQCLMTKVKDLEVELETTRLNCRENMQQAVLSETERFTQMQRDMEELRRKCLEAEMKLKFEEDERLRLLAESTKASVIQEKKMLQQELDMARKQLEHLQKHHDEFELKSNTDVKLIIKEVKSLRGSQLELKQQLSELKEKLDMEEQLSTQDVENAVGMRPTR